MILDDTFEAGFEEAFEKFAEEGGRGDRRDRRRFDEETDIPQERNFNEGLDPARSAKLVIFGGSFDPIHNGHLNVASKLLELGLGDEVMFIPAKQQPLKDGHCSTPEQRLEMLKLALEKYAKFSFSDIELQREGEASYTIDTMRILAKFYPDCKLYFLMGTDSLKRLHEWKNAFELVNRYDFIIYPRAGVIAPSYAELIEHFGNRIAAKLIKSIVSAENLPVWDMASTALREVCKNGGDLSEYVPEAVGAYIRDNQIYQ